MNTARLIIAPLSLALIAGSLVACGASAPKRIDPTGDRKVTTMEVDYDEIIEWSTDLTDRMLASRFLDVAEYQPHPVRMVVSDIENKTDMAGFPYEMMMGRIRATLLNSQKVRYVATYGRDGTDTMPADTEELPRDPRFENPEWTQQKFSVARLSLRTQILYRAAASGRQRQRTYEVRMFVVDNANGEVVWEGFSDPVGKVSSRPRIGG